MKSIKFSESELEFLQNHYELELLDAENYVGEIKNILKKLGKIEKEITREKPAKNNGKKRGRPKKNQKAITETTIAPAVKKVKVASKKVKEVKKTTPKAVKSAPASAPAEASKAE